MTPLVCDQLHRLYAESIQVNDDHIIFLYALINLRIHNFECTNEKLSKMTFYQCKDACGKIQPAIASTNAQAAALEIFHVLSFLNKKP